MCGRTALYLTASEIEQQTHQKYKSVLYKPSYNVFPTQIQPVWTAAGITEMKWGFPLKSLIINARDDSILDKPSFKNKERCVIFANAYYEWKQKQPYCFKSKDLFYFAGLCQEIDGIKYYVISLPNI